MASRKRTRETEEEPPSEGYPEEIFIDLNDEERQDFQCNICLQVVRQPVFCENVHFFCKGCLDRWKEASKNLLDFYDEPKTGTECPVCRTMGTFTEDEELAKLIRSRAVVCQEPTCNWTGELTYYDEHVKTRHRIGEPSQRRLRSERSSSATTVRVTYNY